MTSSQHSILRHQRAFILGLLIFGLLDHVTGVTYQLTANPEKVAIGQTLVLTAKLINPTQADTDLKLTITQPGKNTVTLFHYRAVEGIGCEFLAEPYISSGVVTLCDPANSQYRVRFGSVTAAHIGTYFLQAPFENPSSSASTVNVQLLVPPTSLVLTPVSREVVEGQSANFDCTVDDQATPPVTLEWKRIVNGVRVLISETPPSRIKLNDRSMRVSWESVPRNHAGQYVCEARNSGGVNSELAELVVYYPADVELASNVTSNPLIVNVATTVTLTCTSTGGNPARPGLIIYDVTSGATLKESSGTTLTWTKKMQKPDNGAKYRCKTKTNILPAKESNILTFVVRFPPNGITAPASVTIEEGKREKVSCRTTSSSKPETVLRWSGPAIGAQNTTNPPGDHGGLNTVQDVILTADRARNGSTYSCKATLLGQSIASATTVLIVIYAPDTVTLSANATTAAAGNYVTFTCEAQGGNPLPALKIYNTADNETSLAELQQDIGTTLTFTKQMEKRDNGAEFGCKTGESAVYQLGVVISDPVVIEVQFPPDDISLNVPETVTVPEGQDKTFTCETTTSSNPAAQLDWTGLGVDPLPMITTEISFGIKSSRDAILSVDRTMNGETYTCTATHLQKTYTKSTTLNVTYVAESVSFTSDSSTTVIGGTRVTFTCESIGGNPIPEIVIFDNKGDVLKKLPKATARQFSVEKVMNNADDGSSYRCRTEENPGAGITTTARSAAITYSVLHAASSVTLTSPSTTVVSGTEMTLTCTSDGGNPTPGLVIYDVTSGTATQVEELLQPESKSTLAYSRRMVDSDDGSKFRCDSRVTVNVGTIPAVQSNILAFRVLYPATSVTLTTNATTVIAGATVTLTCESAGGNPQPGLVIYNVTSNSTLKELSQSRGTTLTYQTVMEKRDDGSEFGCRAEAIVDGAAVPMKESKVIAVGVLHPASSVTLTTESTAVFAETTVTLTCTSVDGNPMPGLVIYDVASGRTVKEMAQNTSRSLEFQKMMEKSDNGTQYGCKTKVDIDDYPVKESQTLTFLVLHAATSVTLSASATTVDAGTSVTLTCRSVGGNPVPGLVIFDDKNPNTVLEELPQSSGKQVTHQKTLEKSDNGAEFSCKTKVEVGSVTLPEKNSNVIAFDIQFPPDGIKTTKEVTLDEGQSESLQCETTSSSNPDTELRWTPTAGKSVTNTLPGANGGIKTTRDVVVVGDRSRNGAVYTCMATYRGKQISTANTTLYVNFPPRSIQFYNTLSTPVLENEDRVMRCRTGASNPEGIIRWKKLLAGQHSDVSTGAPKEVSGDNGGVILETEITITATRNENDAEYWCEVEYTFGNNTKVTEKPASNQVLAVYYPTNSVTLTAGPTTIDAGTAVTLTCTSGGGNPVPGLVIYNVVTNAEMKQQQESVSSTLTFTKTMQKEDNGAKLACKTTSVTVGASTIIAELESVDLTFNVQYPPDGIKTPDTVTLDEGQSTTIRCETSSSANPVTELKWTGPALGQSVLTTALMDFGVKAQQDVTITGHRSRNDATYTCTAKHLGQQISTSITKLAVNFAPEAIAFHNTPDTPIIERQTRIMKCRAGSSKPAGTITWYSKMPNDQPSVIQIDSQTQVPGDFGGIVLETQVAIKPTRTDDGAEYWCEVDYTYSDGRVVKNKAAERVLKVYYTANVTLAADRVVNDGEASTFTCRSQGGNPVPGLIIYNVTSGTTLKELDQLEKRSLTHQRTLGKSDNGKRFGCKTKVNVDEGTVPVSEAEQVTISVLFAPDGVRVAKASVAMDEGKTASLLCETTSSSNPVAHIKWSGDGVAETTATESPGAHNGVIAVGNADLTGDRTRNGATYTCTATWGQQTFTATAKIDVNFPPKAIAFYNTSDTHIKENESKVMKCRAETSKPAGTITWWKQRTGGDKQRLQTTPTMTESPGDFGGTVLETEVSIQVTRQDNGARCWCEVEYTRTDGTTVNRKAEMKMLDVYYPVDVTIATSNAPVIVGDDVTLTCDTTGGNPRAISAYSWSFNGTIVKGQTKKTLLLEKVEYDRTGTYVCNATTEAGTTTGRMDMKVGLVGTTGGVTNASLIGAGAGVSILLIVVIVLIVFILLYRAGRLGAGDKRKRGGYADSFDGGREESPYAEASFVNGGPGAPPKKGRFFKRKNEKLSTIREEFNPYETTYDVDDINPYGTTNATPLEEINPYGTTFGKAGPSEEDINPYGTTFGKAGPSEEEINPYGTTFGKAGPSSGVTHAEVNNQDSQAQAPLYAQVDKTKKKTPAPLYAEVDRSKKKPPEPLYAAVDKSRKSKIVQPDEAVYAEINPDTKKSNQNGHAPVPDEAIYANLADVTTEQPRTHVGVDGVVYTELVQGPPTPSEPLIRPDPTIYAEIDIRQSMPPRD